MIALAVFSASVKRSVYNCKIIKRNNSSQFISTLFGSKLLTNTIFLQSLTLSYNNHPLKQHFRASTMCEQKTKKYVCSRCSNLIFLGPSIITECDRYRWGKRCGCLEQLDIIRCEPDLCSRCPFLPADSPLPFTGKPDVAPGSAHDVENRTRSQQSKKIPYEYVGSPALEKTRKMYLVGGVDPDQKE